MNVTEFLSQEATLYRSDDIGKLLKIANQKKVISFGGGLPDFTYFPFEEAISLAEEAIKNNFTKAMQYSPSKGVEPFLSAIINLMSKDLGLKFSENDDILTTTGSQQAIDLVARAFINPGDYLIIEKPTYLAALNVFIPKRPNFIAINMDEKGLDTEALEEKLKKNKNEGKKVKLLYTIPSNHNPTGITMDLDRRKHLIELSELYDFFILEDDPYSLLVFEGIRLPTLKSLDKSGRVLYTSTLSKILSPGLRLGWIVGHKSVIEVLTKIKESTDLHSSTLSQYIAASWIENGIHRKFLSVALNQYKNKRDLMIEELQNSFGDNITFTRPKGGLFLMVTFNENVNTRELLEICLKKGLLYVPGDAFFVNGEGKNSARLNFSYPSNEEISRGVKLLHSSYKEYISSFHISKT